MGRKLNRRDQNKKEAGKNFLHTGKLMQLFACQLKFFIGAFKYFYYFYVFINTLIKILNLPKMKKILFFALIIGIAIINYSGTPMNRSNQQKDFNKKIKLAPHNLFGSGFATIYNQSVNTISSIVVQQIYSPGNSVSTTYSSPSLPLQVPVNGISTIIIHFVHSGPEGTIYTYQETSTGDWTLIHSEQYDPYTLSPFAITVGGTPNYMVYYEVFVRN